MIRALRSIEQRDALELPVSFALVPDNEVLELYDTLYVRRGKPLGDNIARSYMFNFISKNAPPLGLYFQSSVDDLPLHELEGLYDAVKFFHDIALENAY